MRPRSLVVDDPLDLVSELRARVSLFDFKISDQESKSTGDQMSIVDPAVLQSIAFFKMISAQAVKPFECSPHRPETTFTLIPFVFENTTFTGVRST